jgi:2-iminobutanoate/2-iminopropanoate deaminase
MKKIVSTPGAPKAIGPYSQAVKANGFLFVSGQIALDPVTNDLAYGGVSVQLHQVFANIKAILAAEALSLKNVVKCVVFLKTMDDFPMVNTVYGEYFKEDCPARSCVEVGRLPKGAEVEVEVIAAYSL